MIGAAVVVRLMVAGLLELGSVMIIVCLLIACILFYIGSRWGLLGLSVALLFLVILMTGPPHSIHSVTHCIK